MGRNFSNLMTKMTHKYGFVHADPHSGNLLVRKDNKGKDQLVILDCINSLQIHYGRDINIFGRCTGLIDFSSINML